MKKAMIYGAGVSGAGASKLLKNKGYEVLLIDDKKGISSEEALKYLKDMDIFIKSPGIPYNFLVKKAMEYRVEIIDEIEAAYRLDSTGAKIIAVTGTNGKTTTTSKIAGLIEKAGYMVEAGGNIGKSYSEIIMENRKLDYIVLELSSYQLENINSFKAYISMIINLSPDHLDRYDKLESYYDAKMQVLKNQSKEDWFIYNCDSLELNNMKFDFIGKKINISSQGLKEADYYVEDSYIKRDGIKLLNINKLSLKGKHNLENIMFILSTAQILNIDLEIIKEYLYTTEPLEHRMEVFFEDESGVVFVNDSKGTNIDSTIKAIEAYNKKPILICGGKDKNVDLNPLAQCIAARVKKLYLMGQTANEIEKLVRERGFKEIFNLKTLEDVIEKLDYEEGDIILFSPAHSSFDQFKSYIHRGLEFKRLVREKFE